MGSKFAAVVAAAALIAAGSTASAQVQPTGSWGPESGGDTFYYGASVTDGTYLYLVGGYQNGILTSYPYVMAQFRRYDPVANTWTVLPQIAAGIVNGSALWGVRYHASAYYDGRIFNFGGQTYSGTVGSSSYSTAYTNAIRAFDFATQTWSTLSATLSSTRYHLAAATLGDRIYVAGGVSTNVLEIFNPGTNTISPGTSMPAYLYYHALASVPAVNKLYALGGNGPAGYTGINYQYTPEDNDPATPDAGGSWISRTNINIAGNPLPLYRVPPMVLNNRVYLAGGADANWGEINQTHEYNPFTDTWTQRAGMAYQHYGHAAVAINGKGYVYGGTSFPNSGEEFTPPDFGSAPEVPSGVLQSGARSESALQAQSDATAVDGWTNNQVTFSADITDPNVGQQVRLRVQVKPAAASWTQTSQVASLDSGLKIQGPTNITYVIPSGGGYDWRWRVEDAFGNSYPEQPGSWSDGFSNSNSPDFRSDQVAPSDPVAKYPHATDIQVSDPALGPVALSWEESNDNGPGVGIQYEVQVATEGGFQAIEAQLFSPAGTSELTTTLAVSRYSKFWRVRAKDIGGNLSQWSAPLDFRVTYNDGLDHSAGDAKKSCSFSAGAGGVLALGIFGGLAVLLGGVRRRVRGR